MASLVAKLEAAARYAEEEIVHLIETHGQLPAGIVRAAEQWVEEEIDKIEPQPPAAPVVPAAVQSAAPVAAS